MIAVGVAGPRGPVDSKIQEIKGGGRGMLPVALSPATD